MRRITLFVILPFIGCATLVGTRIAADKPQGPSPRGRSFAHYLAAAVYQRQGRLEEAAKELREAADLSPESIDLRIELIQTYLRLQDFDNARIACEETVARMPENPRLWFALGLIHNQLERYGDAEEAFKQAIEIEPNNPMLYEALFELAEGTNDLVAALDACEKLIELRPDAAQLHFRRGWALARIDDSDGAIEALRRAIELDPDHPQARYLLGIVLLGADKNEEAAKELQTCLDQKPTDEGARGQLAAALARLHRYPEAIEILRDLIEDGAADPHHHIACMYLLIQTGRYDEVEATAPPLGAPIFSTLMSALARKGRNLPYLALLESLDGVDGDIDAECQECVGELLRLSPKQEAGTFLIAALKDLRGQGVRSKFLDIILARVFMGLERDEEAETVLLEALNAFGPDKWLHYYLATVYDALDRVAETEHHLRACLALDPDNPEVMNFLGYFYAEEDMKLDEAEELLKRALDIEPESGFYLDSLGWVYYRKGDADRAIDLIRKAILAMHDDDAILRDHLGDAFLLKGDVEKALAEWKRARRLDPDLEGVQEKIDQHRKPSDN